MVESKSDFQIQQEVLLEIKWDSRVEATKVGVTADRGVVTLTGTVGSFAEKLAAQEAAHRVPGVLDVANDLQVKVAEGAARTDTEIAQAVRRALEWDALVPGQSIQSTVSDGWVTLAGSVAYLRQGQDALRAVRNLAGVRGVTNQLRVVPPTLRPGDVQRLIEQALERQALREADRIEISVTDGEVDLSGRVRTWAERRAILGAVSHAPGVQTVNCRISVDPG